MKRLTHPVLASLLLMPSFTGCLGLRNPSVHYVLPDGYTGVFEIILDEQNGLDVTREGWSYTYEIPPDGVLRVRSFAPFRRMHTVTAAYRSGSGIVIPDSTVSDDTIALRSLGSYTRADGPDTMVSVIGTKKEADRVLRLMGSPEFDNVPPNP